MVYIQYYKISKIIFPTRRNETERRKTIILLRFSRLENGGAWSKILLAYNASSRPVELQLEAGRWELLADERSSFWWQEHPAVQRARVQPMAAMILGQRKQE